MRTRPYPVVAIGCLVAAAALLMAFRINADQIRKPQNAPEMVETAKNALRSTMAAQLAGRATIEDIYQWSRRLMDAELVAGTATASADHLERMDTLHKKVEALYKTASKGGSEDKYHASKFYLLEAQAMAAK